VLNLARQAGIELKVAEESVIPVPTSAFPLPARRPLNSRLDASKLQTTFDVHLPLWQIGVERMLEEILGSG
jgi:dTDP-4-dehydrorhamnose reductase